MEPKNQHCQHSLMLTFFTYAQRRHIEVGACESSAEGENVEGKYRVPSLSLK